LGGLILFPILLLIGITGYFCIRSGGKANSVHSDNSDSFHGSPKGPALKRGMNRSESIGAVSTDSIESDFSASNSTVSKSSEHKETMTDHNDLFVENETKLSSRKQVMIDTLDLANARTALRNTDMNRGFIEKNITMVSIPAVGSANK